MLKQKTYIESFLDDLDNISLQQRKEPWELLDNASAIIHDHFDKLLKSQ